jgi:hypothetical protein
MTGLGSPFNYRVITASQAQLFENRLNKAVEDGATVIQHTFAVAKGESGTNYSILVIEDQLPLRIPEEVEE